jgi:hypothetical protein
MNRTRLILVVIILATSETLALGEQVLGVTIPHVGKFTDCVSSFHVDCAQPRTCDVAVTIDTRDCMRCIQTVLKLFGGGGCIQISDPVCEATKAAQNAANQASAAAQRSECERLKTETRAQCEAAVGNARSKCEASKALDIASAKATLDKYQQLVALSKRQRAFRVTGDLQQFVFSKLSRQAAIELLFYKFADSESLYNRALLYLRPTVYVNASQIPDVSIVSKRSIQSVGSVTFIDATYRLTVEDVVRAAALSVFFAELGADGVAQLQKSGKFNLGNVLDTMTNRVCSSLSTNRERFTCDAEVSLN